MPDFSPDEQGIGCEANPRGSVVKQGFSPLSPACRKPCRPVYQWLGESPASGGETLSRTCPV